MKGLQCHLPHFPRGKFARRVSLNRFLPLTWYCCSSLVVGASPRVRSVGYLALNFDDIDVFVPLTPLFFVAIHFVGLFAMYAASWAHAKHIGTTGLLGSLCPCTSFSFH